MTEVQKQNLIMGYCCINVTLRNIGIFCSRTCRLDTLRDKGLQFVYSLARQNLKDLACILKWNYSNKIYLYRMSSEMFPFASHPDYYQQYDIEQFRQMLQSLGQLAKKYNQRLTYHPGQYNQLTSQKESVVQKTVVDINFHAQVMDMMNLDSQSVIVIHGGAKNEGKQHSLQRFANNFKLLSPSSQKRLVLENCEMAYSIEDLLPLCQQLQVPLVVDFHHHNINPGTQHIDKLLQQAVATWKNRNIVPLFHLSESKPNVSITDSITKRRAHSDYVQSFPESLLQLLQTEVICLDIEAKQKELAVLQLLNTHF